MELLQFHGAGEGLKTTSGHLRACPLDWELLGYGDYCREGSPYDDVPHDSSVCKEPEWCSAKAFGEPRRETQSFGLP